MSEPGRRHLNYDDLLAADMAEPERSHELIGGSLVYRAGPRNSHALAQIELGTELAPSRGRGGGPGGWWILSEVDTWLASDTVLRPDVAGWRKSTLPTLPDGPIDVRPDWVCEVLSPSHHRRDRLTKGELYLAAGVPHYWLVDPEARTLEAFELRDGLWLLLGVWTDGAELTIPPFEHPIAVGHLFVPEPEPAVVGEPAAAWG